MAIKATRLNARSSNEHTASRLMHESQQYRPSPKSISANEEVDYCA